MRKKEFFTNFKKKIHVPLRIHLTTKLKLLLFLIKTRIESKNHINFQCSFSFPSNISKKRLIFHRRFENLRQIHRLRRNVKRLCKSLWLPITRFLFVACLHSAASFWPTEILLQRYERIVWKMRSVALSHVSHSRSLGDDKVTHGSKISVGCFTTPLDARFMLVYVFKSIAFGSFARLIVRVAKGRNNELN